MFFGMLSVVQGFSYWWGWGRRVGIPPTNWKIAHPLTWKTPPPIFIFTSYSLYTQVMLIFILMDVQYLQNVVFTFEKGLNDQTHSLSGSHRMIKKVPTQQSFSSPLHTPYCYVDNPVIWEQLSFSYWFQNSDLLRDEKNVKTMFEIKRYLVKMFV